MTYQFPADIDERIKALLASGDYVGEDDVLRSAVHALEQRRQEVAAIREGLADVEAGRVRPWGEVDAEIREKHGFSADKPSP